MGAESVGLFIATLNMLPQWDCIYDGLCLQQGSCVCETPRTVFAKHTRGIRLEVRGRQGEAYLGGYQSGSVIRCINSRGVESSPLADGAVPVPISQLLAEVL
jgi:hypothetical protein